MEKKKSTIEAFPGHDLDNHEGPRFPWPNNRRNASRAAAAVRRAAVVAGASETATVGGAARGRRESQGCQRALDMDSAS